MAIRGALSTVLGAPMTAQTLSFAPTVQHAIAPYPSRQVVTDWNRDGNPDVAVDISASAALSITVQR